MRRQAGGEIRRRDAGRDHSQCGRPRRVVTARLSLRAAELACIIQTFVRPSSDCGRRAPPLSQFMGPHERAPALSSVWDGGSAGTRGHRRAFVAVGYESAGGCEEHSPL